MLLHPLYCRYRKLYSRARRLDMLARVYLDYGTALGVPQTLSDRVARVCERLSAQAARQPYQLGEGQIDPDYRRHAPLPPDLVYHKPV